jgi:hypothetical protein
MHPEAVEGLLEEGILTESGLSPEATATVSAGEQARRQGHRVAKGEGRVVGDEGKKLLPEVFLDLPEVGSLTAEGGAVHFTECGEPLTVMTPEVTKDRLVGGHTEELAYDLDGENLGVGELWGRATLTDATPFEPVVD